MSDAQDIGSKLTASGAVSVSVCVCVCDSDLR